MKKTLLLFCFLLAFYFGNAQAPLAPSELSANAFQNLFVGLGWADNSDNETSFVVERSLNSGSGFETIALLAAGTTIFVDEVDSSNTIYYYRVKAMNGTESSAYTSEVSAVSDGILGNTDVFETIVYGNKQRAVPATMTMDGYIESVSMYHESGDGNMLLAVYADEGGAPGAKLGTTASTQVSAATDWQVIDLISPVQTFSGQKVWLAWSYETIPGIRALSGTATVAISTRNWTGGMPSDYGSSTIDNINFSIYAIYQSFTVLHPSNPTNLTATPQTDMSVDLSWTDNAIYEDSYEVWRSTNPGIGHTKIAGLPMNATSYIDATVAANTNYYYIVKAVNIAGSSDSGEAPALTGNATVGYTEVFSNTAYGNKNRAMQVTMSSDGLIKSISMYHEGGSGNMLLAIYADDGGLPGTRLGETANTLVSGSSGWQTINLISSVGVASGQQLWLAWSYSNIPGIRYKVGTPGIAVSNSKWTGSMPAEFGSSAMSNYVFSIYADYQSYTATTPNAPSSLSATAQIDLSVDLTWVDNSSNELSFEVERSLTLGGVYSLIATMPANTSNYSDASLTANTTYYYRVRAINGAGNSAYTTVVSEITANTPIGNSEVFKNIDYGNKRRAVPVSIPSDGLIENISMYHDGGGGNMLLAVYTDAGGFPGTRLGVTATTPVSGTPGWQTINLISSVAVTSGQQLWLAWSYSNIPGIRYTVGTPGIAVSNSRWTGSMPSDFGSNFIANYLFSISAGLNTGGGGGRIAGFGSTVKAEVENSPKELAMYPNPFDEVLNIEFNVPKDNSFVSLSMMDATGREITKLVEGQMSAGMHYIQWNGLVQNGTKANTGLYILRGIVEDTSFTKRVILK